MARTRRLIAAGFVLSLALAGGSAASAASPQEIYRDLGDNGVLDGNYTRGEIERALNPRQVLGTDARRPALSSKRNLDGPEPVGAATPAPEARGDGRRVPFSGLDLALLIAGGAPLLLIGAGLRRRLASAPAEAPAAGA